MKANKQNQSIPQVSLSRTHRAELIFDAIITLGIVIFIYLGVILILRDFFPYFFYWTYPEAWSFIQYNEPTGLAIIQYVVMLFILLSGLGIVFWRVKHRQTQMELNNILKVVEYIAQGHYEYRIDESLVSSQRQSVVKSINQLLDSAVAAIEEERRAEQIKDELVTNVGHDLRTPLTSIIGYLGLVTNDTIELSPEESHQYLTVAYSKAQHMQTLVDDLFEYTASRSPTYCLNKSTLPVYLFLSQLAAEFELLAQEEGMTIEIEVDSQDIQGYFDVEKMARVFNNLITNALKYAHHAKKITLAAFETKDHCLCLEVRNDGEMIPEEELEKIFLRSYRTDTSRNSDQSGSGLGLSIVKNIIHHHEGTIHAEIVDDELVFKMILPMQKESEEH